MNVKTATLWRIVLWAAVAAGAALPSLAEKEADYPVRAADMTNVAIKAGFWLSRFETNRVVTVTVDFKKSEETGRLANFREAAKRAQGTFKGCPFDDSDVFKIIEGAAYTLATHPDPKLEKYLDDLIADIAGAQEADGYLYTARTLGMEKVKGFRYAEMMGAERWSNTNSSHEFYNMGHMIEAGVAYWRVTGKRSLLDVAIKAADMMDRTFGYDPGQIQRVPGHEEIELALCKLYRATGEIRYLKLAKTLLDFRGGGHAFSQNHLPVTQQNQACGHAVRAGYLYIAMADVAALLGDPSYRVATERLWKDVVDTKLHLNGGIGAHRRAVVPGFGHVVEAFGAPYDLPNENAYLETCAAIANALWNDRLFLFSGDGKYMDVIERIIYNGFLSGVSLSGDEFFYPNPLASAGGYARSKWFGCSCCPVNAVRFIPQIAQFAYATSGNTAYLNLYIASDVRLALSSGTVRLSQETAYPWSGKVKIKVMPGRAGSPLPAVAVAGRPPCQDMTRFTLKIRIPGWCVGRPVPSALYAQTEPSPLSSFKVKVNGEPFAFTPEKGYCSIDRSWKDGDVVEVDMDMPVKRIKADSRVAADRGRLAVERGPVVWCAEGIDNGGHARDIVLPSNAVFAETCVDVCGVRMPALTTTGHHAAKGISKVTASPDVTVKLIPYFAWCHREAGEMQTWFPTSDEVVAPCGPTAAARAYAHAPCPLMTTWGEQITPANAWREYPRPQMVRPNWTNLNGEWDYAVTSVTNTPGRPKKWDGKILVPFCLESALSGVGRLLEPDQFLWYTRTITCDPKPGERILLHFGGVDFRTMVFIGHNEVTDVPHEGGQNPFTLDITDYVKPGTNELTVCVWDPTENFINSHGKQSFRPRGCIYTRVSGIWQTVWMETVPACHIESYEVVTDIDKGTATLDFRVRGSAHTAAAGAIKVTVDGVGEFTGNGTVVVKMPAGFKLWSPESPNLYAFTAACGADAVKGYFGMRKIEKRKDAKGVLRFFLNNRPCFVMGTLDQGWWPDGLLTPPSDAAMAYDIQVLKDCGFNTIRKHIKVEPLRYYYLCDKMGILVIQDLPSGNFSARTPLDAKETARYGLQRLEQKEMMDALQAVPSIIMWNPYNEGWSQPGEFLTHAMLDFTRRYDPTRLVNGPSGCWDWEGGHCLPKDWKWENRVLTRHKPAGECEAADTVDLHLYRGPEMFAVNDRRISFLGEFGGLSHSVEGHLWRTSKDGNWGYGGSADTKTREGLEKTYLGLMDKLGDLAEKGLGGAIFTQTTDVEVEINGVLTYDRKVLKYNPAVLKAAHERVCTRGNGK